MLLLVSLTLAGCTERLITLTTLERALSVSNVNIHVASERAICREGSITYLTPEILCSHMSFHVSFKYARRHKFFFTGDAFVRFFPCVSPVVLFEVTELLEDFVDTDVTAVGLAAVA